MNQMCPPPNVSAPSHRPTVRRLLCLTAALSFLIGPGPANADEQLFGFVRGAETLPKGKAEVYQFVTYRTGKDSGTYHGLDFDTEVEYGFTDRFQSSLAIVNHYNYNKNVDGLDDFNRFQFGG